jgi:hypothetical protein
MAVINAAKLAELRAWIRARTDGELVWLDLMAHTRFEAPADRQSAFRIRRLVAEEWKRRDEISH